MSTAILVAVISGVVTGLLGCAAAPTRGIVRDRLDRRRVYRWLLANTRDEPGESHADTVAVAKGTRLSEDRARRACMVDARIYRDARGHEGWSVWRYEPQSIYEKRGPLVV